LAQERAQNFAAENDTIINLLELFEGKVSLTEILTLDQSRLFGLADAKARFNEAKFKRKEEAKEAASTKKT